MIRKKYPSLPSAIDFHRPVSNIGIALDHEDKEKLHAILRVIKQFYHEIASEFYLSNHLNRIIDEIICYILIEDESKTCKFLSELCRFIRISLTSMSPLRVKKATILSDTLVKNCGKSIHKVIGKKHFMKTLSLVARRQMAKNRTQNREVGLLLLDTIQAWGEAFSSLQLRHEYPYYFETYFKLRTKYNMPFGEQFDPTRVPILLGPTRHLSPEIIFLRHFSESDNSMPSREPKGASPLSSSDGGDLIEFSSPCPTVESPTQSHEVSPDWFAQDRAVEYTTSEKSLENWKYTFLNSSAEDDRGTKISEMMSPSNVSPVDPFQPFTQNPFSSPTSPLSTSITSKYSWDSNTYRISSDRLTSVVSHAATSAPNIDTQDCDMKSIVTYFGSQRVVRHLPN